MRSLELDYEMVLTEDQMDYRLKVKGVFEPTDWAMSLVNEFGQDGDRITHRSRGITIASSALRKVELERRVLRKEGYATFLDKVINRYTPKFSELNVIRADLLEQNCECRFDKMASYVAEHRTSSIMPGVKWHMLEDELPLVYEDLHELVLNSALDMGNHEGEYFAVPLFQGMRARSLDLGPDTTYSLPSGDKWVIEGYMPRTRIVMFHPKLSMANLVISNKTRYYEGFIDAFKDILGIRTDIRTPLVHGGRVYTYARDLLKKGYVHRAIDGKNHESNVIDILGRPATPYGTTIAEQIHLPSGIAETSIYGLLCSLAYVAWIEDQIGEFNAVMLGDDINMILEQEQSDQLDGLDIMKSGLVEEEKTDTMFNYILGLSVKPGEEGLVGLKFMMDRADKMIGISDLSKGSVQLRRKIDPRIPNAMYDGFHNLHGGRDLVDVMSRIEPEDFKGATNAIEQRVEDLKGLVSMS
jgi:hypothetical protein